MRQEEDIMSVAFEIRAEEYVSFLSITFDTRCFIII